MAVVVVIEDQIARIRQCNPVDVVPQHAGLRKRSLLPAIITRAVVSEQQGRVADKDGNCKQTREQHEADQ
jgi:hypothetical protein